MMVRIDKDDLEEIIREAIRNSWDIGVSEWMATDEAMKRVLEKGENDT